jgi:hypothetical protein
LKLLEDVMTEYFQHAQQALLEEVPEHELLKRAALNARARAFSEAAQILGAWLLEYEAEVVRNNHVTINKPWK